MFVVGSLDDMLLLLGDMDDGLEYVEVGESEDTDEPLLGKPLATLDDTVDEVELDEVRTNC